MAYSSAHISPGTMVTYASVYAFRSFYDSKWTSQGGVVISVDTLMLNATVLSTAYNSEHYRLALYWRMWG